MTHEERIEYKKNTIRDLITEICVPSKDGLSYKPRYDKCIKNRVYKLVEYLTQFKYIGIDAFELMTGVPLEKLEVQEKQSAKLKLLLRKDYIIIRPYIEKHSLIFSNITEKALLCRFKTINNEKITIEIPNYNKLKNVTGEVLQAYDLMIKISSNNKIIGYFPHMDDARVYLLKYFSNKEDLIK